MAESRRSRDLVTARLSGCIPNASDAQYLEPLLRDPRVARTLGGIRTPEQVRQILDRFTSHWERRGFGPWILRDFESGSFAGYGGLVETLAEAFVGEIEILYALAPAFWNQGLATEMSIAALGRGFGEWRLPWVIAFTLPTNRASRAVMEKTGLRHCGEFDHRGAPHLLYRLEAEEWRARRLPAR